MIRNDANSSREFGNLDEACEQQTLVNTAHMDEKNSKKKVLKMNLGACQIYEAPSKSSKGSHEQLAIKQNEDEPQSHKIRLPKLNLEACHNYATPSKNSVKDSQQQVGGSIEVVHNQNTTTRSSEVEYVDAWQNFFVEDGSFEGLHSQEEWKNGIDLKLESNKINHHTNLAATASSNIVHEQRTLDIQALNHEQTNETRPLKLKLGTCNGSLLPGMIYLKRIHLALEL